MTDKEYITFRKQYVYNSSLDASKKQNPLFAFECKVSEIDFSRVKSLDGIDVEYSLTKPETRQ